MYYVFLIIIYDIYILENVMRKPFMVFLGTRVPCNFLIYSQDWSEFMNLFGLDKRFLLHVIFCL